MSIFLSCLVLLSVGEETDHWAFRELRSPAVPESADPQFRTAVDRFLFGDYESIALEELSRRDLLRRATFDLHGLPATTEDIEAFEKDKTPGAFDRWIDKLLDSPRYGERWGRHWLDVVRFGEDDPRSVAEDEEAVERYEHAHVYRDWVIQSFQDDAPYDEFIRRQIAGDLIPDRPVHSLGGLGLLGAGPWLFDNAEPAVARADERHDRVDVITRGFLGLTIACARCHDHKYDPITMDDYYGLSSVFANTEYHEYPIGPEDAVQKYLEYETKIKATRDELRDTIRSESRHLASILVRQSIAYMVGAWKVQGKPQRDPVEVANSDRLDLETFQRWLDFLRQPPEYYDDLRDWQNMVASGGSEEEARRLAEVFQERLLQVAAEQRKIQKRNDYIIANGAPPPWERSSTPMPNGVENYFDMPQLELEALDRPAYLLFEDVFVRNIRTGFNEYKPGLLRFWEWGLERRLGDVDRKHIEGLRSEIDRLKNERPKIPVSMGVRDKDPEDIKNWPRFERGNPHQPGAIVERRFPQVLGGRIYKEGSGRRQLADDIARHPLSSRVIVNRVWQWHFGRGLVSTSGDFGKTGMPPTHPDLLEYLAHWFDENGGSIKALHRLLMTSTVYRLKRSGQAEDHEAYLAHPIRQLSAEALRDSMLAVAGTLDLAKSPGSFDLDDAEETRRSVFGSVSRYKLSTFLQTFDFPDPTIPCHGRFETAGPTQQLFFLNSKFVGSRARELWSSLPEGSIEKRTNELYRRLFSRSPTPIETESVVHFLTSDGTPIDALAERLIRLLFASTEFRSIP